MLGVRLLPWDYGVRNVFRRPVRSALTLATLTLVVLLVLVVVGLVRGLEAALAVSGDPRVVLVHAAGAAENVENSSVHARTTGLLTASLPGIQRRQGPGGTTIPYASPELFLGTQVAAAANDEPSMGLVRGVTPAAALVRSKVQITEGRWPRPGETPGEVLVGRLAAAKLGLGTDVVAVGQLLTFEGKTWRVCGTFAAAGSTLEAELWCALEDLQRDMKRQDLTVSLVAITLAPGASFGDVDEFCKANLEYELQATPETAHYDALARHYGPVRALAWVVVLLIAGAGAFAGLNAMYGAVAGRVRELATLQALGFLRRAIALALVQEAALLAAAAALLACAIALLFVNGMAVRFTMGAFALRIDGVAVAVGCGTGLLLGAAGAIPPAVRAMRLPVVEGLKSA